MNIKYYHEFIGSDDINNRFEILTNDAAKPVLIEATSQPFALEYAEVKKIEPVRGSQATLELICKSIFQFRDLHTDSMQGYLVKFYRAGILYWMGWIDSETYGEELSAVPPYPVVFKASDFNILERLKYQDDADRQYTNIVPFITHLKRCFNKLNLPFSKLFIGCTTNADGISLSASETVLHKLYMMSSNFYDEDNEPMSCREVLESILKPFGLMIVQLKADVYLYDYNTIKNGLPFKRYNFATLSYEANEIINFNLGNLHEIGFKSTDSPYSYEELINNVSITSSLYAAKDTIEGEVTEENVSELILSEETDKLKKETFFKCEAIENIKNKDFIVYTNKDSDSTIIGARSGKSYTRVDPSYRLKSKELLIASPAKNYLLLKVDVYVNIQDNPFDAVNKISPGDAEVCALDGNLYTVNEEGKPLYYFSNTFKQNEWIPCDADGAFIQGRLRISFCNQTVKGSNIVNTWVTNSNVTINEIDANAMDSIQEKNYGKGLMIPLTTNIYGSVILEIGNRIYVMSRVILGPDKTEQFAYNSKLEIKDFIYNKFSLSVVDGEKKELPTDDYEFRSYINKKVATDLEEVTLKCISANEEKAPIGRANILKKIGDHYELQLSFTRSGQTNILERLLMRTIHSNFTTKNEKSTVDVRMTDNPALSYVTYQPILSDNYLVVGCKLNFHEAVTQMTIVGFSADTAELSSIPYE